MTETPHSPDDFPADLGWFDVTRYDTAGEMTADQWRQQIGKRAWLGRLLDIKSGNRQELDQQMGELLDYPLE